MHKVRLALPSAGYVQACIHLNMQHKTTSHT